MKNFKRILALVLAVMMVATSLMVVTSAADDEVVYNEQAITRLNKLGIFKGSTSGDMHADDNVTREQMALFTGRVLTGKVTANYWESYVNDTTFEDIDDEAAEYIGAISYAFEQGIVNGKSEVRFDPKGNVSYQDALKMVVCSLGYTGLSYPNGYINKAIKLGLTADIDGVDYDEAATRGVIATILYNALYAEDSLFAKNFNLTSGLYMLVATPGRELKDGSWLEAATIEGYVGKTINAGYVAFAPIDAHNRAINDNYVYARTSEIADDFAGTYASKLGYAYTLTFEDDKLTWADQCATKTFVNYGDDRDITSQVIKYQPELGASYIKNQAFITFGGQAYALSDGYDPDYRVPTSTQDLILYNVSAEAPVYEYRYNFDANGNIVSADGTEIILYKGNNINREADKYYVLNGTTYTVATAQEMYEALSQCEASTASGYQILGDDYGADLINPDVYNGNNNTAGTRSVAKTIANNYFCEIVAMDYDGDGIYDAGLYTPYFIGYTNEPGKGGLASDENKFTGGWNETITVADWVVSGAASKLSNWTWYIYAVNELNQEIRVIETINNIGKKVTWASKGKITATSSNGNMYLDSQVKFGDVSYKVGGWTNENLYGLNQIDGFDSGKWPAGFESTYDNGWNNILVEAMKAEYSSFKGYAVAGHLVYGYPVLKTVATPDNSNYNFVAFDPYNCDFEINDNDQVVANNVLVDTKGTYKEVVIDTLVAEVYNEKLDKYETYNNAFTNIAYDAFCDYIDELYGDDASIIKYSYFFNDAMKAQFTATNGYKNALRANVIEQLYLATKDFNTGATYADAKPGYGGTQVWTIVEKNADGSLDLAAKLPTAYKTVKAGEVTFTLGVADKAMALKSDGKDEAPIATDKETVFTFVAMDGIYTYVGMPANGDKLVLTANTTLYCADSDAIFVIDESRLVEEIAVGAFDFTSYAKNAANETFERAHNDTWALNGLEIYMPGIYNYPEIYIVLKDTANKEIYVDEDNNPVYVYTNLYDVVNGKKTDVVFVGADAKVFSDYLTNIDGEHDKDGNTEDSTVTVFTPQLMVGTVIYRDADDTLKFADDEVATGDYKGIMNTAFFAQATFNSADKDNLGAWAHVNNMTVRKVTVKVFLAAGAGVSDDLAKATADANMYYQYDALTGDFVAYIFN